MDDLNSKSSFGTCPRTCQNEKDSEKGAELVSEEAEAVMVMKEKLPTYVMDSFIATGFDTLKVISEIDTSSDCDLLEMEQFITEEFKEDSRFKTGFSVRGHFKFLPGHRRRIINFINGLKQEATKSKLKRPKRAISSKYPLAVKVKKSTLESDQNSATSSNQTTWYRF